MYERNAIVIDRFFSNMFGYDEKNNLKNNYRDYCDLVDNLSKYLETYNNENNIMVEYEEIAEKIKELQKKQEILYKKNIKFQKTRRNLFDNLDDDSEELTKKFDRLETELSTNNNEITINIEKFISEISKFHEKSELRIQCGRERKVVEGEYRKILNETSENFSKIEPDRYEVAKNYVGEEERNDIKEEIKLKILKNGSKENISFDDDVISNAIDLAMYIEEKKLELLILAYERTARILNEIKNDSVKIERHKKIVKDAESRLKFLDMVTEYLILFLDNERMNVVGGEKEHKKIMNEACANFSKDVVEIKNMYNLLIKETNSKTTKKIYKELYHPEFMQDLLKQEEDFEKSISKLNVIGTIIYPSYWRVEGMKKVFSIFKEIVTNVYNKDLTEFEPIDENYFADAIEEDEIEQEKNNENVKEENVEIEENYDDDFNEEFDEIEDDFNIEEDDDNEYEEDDDNEEVNYVSNNNDNKNDFEDDEFELDLDDILEEDEEDLQDKAIDEILGFYNNKEEEEESDIDFDWDDEDYDIEEDNEDDDKNYDKKTNEDISFELEDIEEVKPRRKGFFNRNK